jgi:predicted TIM-barrel fold metal-dependent hydrolase
MIIDVHVHIFEKNAANKKFRDKILEHRKRILSEEDFKKFRFDGSVEGLIEDMDQAGVDMAVCLAGDLAFLTQEEPEASFLRNSEYVAEAQAKFPNRIVGFFGIDPFRPGAVKLLEKGIRELGLKGVKLLPGWFYPTDERVAPFMQKIEELGVPALFHAGTDPHPFLVKYGDPRYLDDLLLKYPNLKMIVAHWARGFEPLLNQMLYFRPGRLWADISGWQFEYMSSSWHFLWQMRYFLDRFPDVILMGSDWPLISSAPFPTMKEWVEAIQNMELPQACLDMGMKQFTKEEKNKILGGNAQKLLNL